MDSDKVSNETAGVTKKDLNPSTQVQVTKKLVLVSQSVVPVIVTTNTKRLLLFDPDSKIATQESLSARDIV